NWTQIACLFAVPGAILRIVLKRLEEAFLAQVLNQLVLLARREERFLDECLERQVCINVLSLQCVVQVAKSFQCSPNICSENGLGRGQSAEANAQPFRPSCGLVLEVWFAASRARKLQHNTLPDASRRLE